MSNYADNSPLGKTIAASSVYAPEVLYPIPREQARESLNVSANALPFTGVDVWTAYELSWLGANGKPEVAIAEIEIPCDSPNIVESKSLKLYFNSFNQSKLENAEAVTSLIAADISSIIGVDVEVRLYTLDEYYQRGLDECPGDNIDGLDIIVANHDQPDAGLLSFASQSVVSEQLNSNLFRSNCPVTNQPDWATLYIAYKGQQLDRGALLQYIISYHNHQGFHEQCVEQIYLDLLELMRPLELTVYARFVRRGGLDINPYRTSTSEQVPSIRLVRQ
jgi:7-cyano-7-deazaguanine reductase